MYICQKLRNKKSELPLEDPLVGCLALLKRLPEKTPNILTHHKISTQKRSKKSAYIQCIINIKNGYHIMVHSKLTTAGKL